MESEKKKEEDEVEEPKDQNKKQAQVTQKIISMPRPLPLFPQRLAKKAEEGMYYTFITMLKKLSINITLIKAFEQVPGCTKFIKNLVTKKRASVSKARTSCSNVELLLLDY